MQLCHILIALRLAPHYLLNFRRLQHFDGPVWRALFANGTSSSLSDFSLASLLYFMDRR